MLKLRRPQRAKLKLLFLLEIAPYLMEILGNQGVCESISWIVSTCLRMYGINCYPVRVVVTFGNPYAKSIVEREGIIGLMKNDKKIWTIGLGVVPPGKNPADYFHTVIFFEDDESFLDLTACQASRPKKKMVVENYWCRKNMLPPSVIHFEVVREVDMQSVQGMILQHPRLRTMLNHILKKIAKALQVKPIKAQLKRINKKKVELRFSY